MRPTFDQIIAYTGSVFEVQAREIKGKRRTDRVVIPRNLALYLGYHMTGHSMSALAKMLDKNHTTVMHAINSAENKLQRDGEYRRKAMAILNKLDGKIAATKRVIEREKRVPKSLAEKLGISETAYKNGVRGTWPADMRFDMHPDVVTHRTGGEYVRGGV